ncbi:CbtA family protein [Oceaniglobus roseus]|uniref:CbtA family protein n=1 Tax=Oceaniglobus roseus TaxID=1737570 RepID=UPI000C7EBB61|nr:CbtA family protein [Kandeliimicrobium roseum]
MLKSVLASAVFAGLVAGLCAALLQFAFVIPLLLQGELYETGARVHFASESSVQSSAAAVALGTDWGRHAMTVAFDFVTYTGYGFLLAALMLIAALRGIAITPRAGLVWGLCGFVAVQLAPAFGLPPELPGTVAAELRPRQLWWAGTILATAAGLGCIAFGRGWVPVAGILLILLPQAIGAPQLDTYFGAAPPELAAAFATRSLGAALAGWTLLGGLTALFLVRLGALERFDEARA